jgi:hypothetical protein
MAAWTTNTIMTWAGNKITDHGRDTLNESVERIGSDTRTSNGTLRRFHVANKRTWTVSWSNLPSSNAIAGGMTTADGGWSGELMEDFYNATPGKFRLVLRRGSANGVTQPAGASAAGTVFEDANFYGADVMITEFSKEVVKRGKVDLWNLSVTLEEV